MRRLSVDGRTAGPRQLRGEPTEWTPEGHASASSSMKEAEARKIAKRQLRH